MELITQKTSSERKKAFEIYIKKQVKSAPRYITDLERGFMEAPIKGYESIYDITDPEILENLSVTKQLRESSVFTRKTNGGTAGLAGLNWYIRFLKDSRDSYYDFMNHFNIKPKELFNWGIKSIIFPELTAVEIEWEDLKKRIFNNEEVIIRGYGRDAHGTQLYINFYKYWLNNSHVKKDSTNNNKPQTNIKKMTGLIRNKDIYNYQVSHIWGHTKNIFLFEAPWNICYTPKIIDPFTGHETKGDLPSEFQNYFIKHAQKKYRQFIDDYNNIISTYSIATILKKYCNEKAITDERFLDDAISELSTITII